MELWGWGWGSQTLDGALGGGGGVRLVEAIHIKQLRFLTFPRTSWKSVGLVFPRHLNKVA